MTSVAEFDVAVSTHDLLKQGICVAQYVRVYVLVDDETSPLEASLAALQLATCSGDHVVVTDLLWRL